jgi:mRNA capping enzyme
VLPNSSRVPDPDPKVNDQIKTILEGAVQNVWWTKNTISKSISDLPTQVDKPYWSKGSDGWRREEFHGGTFVRVDFIPSSTKSVERLPKALSLNYPLVASLRRTKISTGAYLKLSPMLRGLTVTTFACLGGGFGGMTSSILRTFPKSTGMFNIQLELTGYHPQGVAPGLPAALDAMPKTVSSRCMNPSTSWEAKTDLTEKETWKQMGDVLGKEGKVNLIILDCEFRTQENEDSIIENPSFPSPMTHSQWEAPSFSRLSGTSWWGNAALFISLGHYSRPWRLCFRTTQEQTPPNFTFASPTRR